MKLINLILLGVLQGVLEWLPVSSTAIVMIFSVYLGIDLETSYDIALALHLGTLIALLAYYRKVYLTILTSFIRNGLKDKRTKYLILSLAGTGVTGIPAYLLVKKLLYGLSLKMFTILVCLLLIFTALLSLMKKKEKTLNSRESFLLGLVQGVAAVPGLSRSGLTIAYLLSIGLTSREAFWWSFFVASPPILGITLYEMVSNKIVFSIEFLTALLASFLTGFITVKTLLKIVEKIKRSYITLGVALGLLVTLFI